MHRWRYPSLSIHGIQGAFGEPGAKTIIPRKVIGKFSIRLVPNMTPLKVETSVKNYLKHRWTERGSPNKMRVKIYPVQRLQWNGCLTNYRLHIYNTN